MSIIYAKEKRYCSEIDELKNGLPFGIFCKRATDVGGTFVTLKVKCNYIIVCPYKGLVNSIMKDINSPYKVFGLQQGVLYKDFKEYILNNSIHKFAVTYDSLPKLIKWLDKNGFNSSEYKVLIDEYHLLLEDMGFRNVAINNLVSLLGHFKHYTLMSATPINEEFLPQCMIDLPFTEIVWEHQRTIMPVRIKTSNVYKTAVTLINEFNDGLLLDYEGEPTKVEELYIFLNSVNGIKEILSSCELSNDEVKIVCSDSIRNNAILNEYDISETTAPNAKINFFTKKGFQGCNLFSNNALVIVISDGNKKHTLIDIETTMYQIVGRLRTNKEYDNIFKDKIWHIFSTRRTVQSEEDFIILLNELKDETEIVISTYNKLDKLERQVYSKRMEIDDLICYYDEENDCYKYSELKEKYLRHNFNLVNHTYQNGITLRDTYIKANMNVTKQIYANCDDIILNKITTVGFKELLKQYIELRESNEFSAIIERYEMEHPIFKEAYNVIGKNGISSCNYVENEIKELIYAKSDRTLSLLYNEFYKLVGEDIFIENKEAKKVIESIYTTHKIKSGKTAVTILKNCKWFEVIESSKRIDGKVTRGITIKKVKRYEL
ncbi:MAG: DEAD/DEAH box helicase family protein [Mariniphaga sp.]|nr:DEAD/DEAH box helicase family protein [Mariniphaga sp.]